MQIKNAPTKAMAFAAAFMMASCESNFPPLQFEADGDRLRLTGIIDARALSAFRQAMSAHPETTHLVFDFVPGSLDDDSNLKLARQIRARGLKTVIPANGLVASGGTDLFLAGAERSLSSDACVGVHTWGDETVGIGSETPKDDPIHELYLSYYNEVDIPETFYWFTLDAAGPYETHWMTADEISDYRFEVPDLDHEPKPQAGDLGTQCELRLEAGYIDLFDRD